MAVNLGTIQKEVNIAISAATSVADLAEKFAGLAQKYGKFVPGAGPEIVAVAGIITTADKLLHTLKNFLG